MTLTESRQIIESSLFYVLTLFTVKTCIIWNHPVYSVSRFVCFISQLLSNEIKFWKYLDETESHIRFCHFFYCTAILSDPILANKRKESEENKIWKGENFREKRKEKALNCLECIFFNRLKSIATFFDKPVVT